MPAGTPARSGTSGSARAESPATAATGAAGRPRSGAHAIAAAIRCPEDKIPQLGEVLDSFTEPTKELRAIGAHLGSGLGSIVNAFNPQMVVLGGYFRALYTLVGAEVDRGLAERTLPAPLESVTLSLPGLGDDSVLLGAAEMAFEPLFVDPVSALGSAIQDICARLAG